MTKKDLFRIIIKLIGLYKAIVLLFVLIPQSMINLVYGFDFELFLWPLITLVLVGLISFILLFKTDSIISLFKLNQGLDDQRIDWNINGETLMQFGLVIIGLLLITNNIADLILNIIYTFKKSIGNNSALDALVTSFDHYQVDYYTLYSAGINVGMGILILTNYRRFSKKIEKWNKKNEEV